MLSQKNIPFIIYFALSAVLLTVIQSPFDMSLWAWIALVPFVMASLVDEKTSLVAFVAYIIGLLYWLGNLYWLTMTTVPGWFVFCLYMALYWPALAMSLRWCVRKRIPLWLSLPILIVSAEALQGLIFNGFCWRYLAHSQYRNIQLIQIADIFGAAGVSFIIAMANGAVSETILSIRNSNYRQSAFFGNLLTIVLVTAIIYYGQYRIDEVYSPGQTADLIEAGPRIGVVQSNVPVRAGRETEPFEETFLDMLRDSRDCLLSTAPQMIIWPETMVEAVLDDSYLSLAPPNDIAKTFHNALVRHSNQGTCLLVGAFAGDAVLEDKKIKLATSYNSAFLYEPNSIAPRQFYNKMHLVPFGEYIPLKDTLPFLSKFLLALTPYDYDYAVDPGNQYTIFKMNSKDRIYRFGVMICYEDTVPKIARKFTLDASRNKQIDWLVNISNDGWFVRDKDGRVIPTTELAQHMAISVFRAVENRVPVFRSVNTGISCYIDSLGNIKNGYVAGTIPEDPAARAGQKGWFTEQVFIDKRITFFSRIGQKLEIGCAICLIFAGFSAMLKKGFVSIYKNRKQNSEHIRHC